MTWLPHKLPIFCCLLLFLSKSQLSHLSEVNRSDSLKNEQVEGARDDNVFIASLTLQAANFQVVVTRSLVLSNRSARSVESFMCHL